MMKHETRKRTWLLIPALIAVSILMALMPSSRVFASVKISKKRVNLYTNGGREKIHLYVYDDGEKVSAKWKSSKKRVATVSSSGVVKAKRTGTAKITATYAGRKFTCRIKVRRTSGTYKKAIKAYNTFLMNPYVTYKKDGSKAQADNFRTIDLDGNGIPELIVNVVTDDGSRYHVLYHFINKKMTTGQILGDCSDFVWYPSRKVMRYREYESSTRFLDVYSKDNGITLNSFAIALTKKNKTTYYISDGSDDTYGEKISAVDFRDYVDHDKLRYSASSSVTLYLNTPYNRSRYL